MNEFRADLHCHTTCSDGSETPEQIIELAKQSNLSALSITDHDTISAYDTAFDLAKAAGISLLTGVEFSSALNQMSVHILGYGFQAKDKKILELCTKHAERRKNRNLAILELLAKHQMPLDYEDIICSIPVKLASKARSIGRPHIAYAMIAKGYVKTPKEAFDKYLGEERLCYIQGETFTVDETIETIHQAKGIAVIAHPHLIKNSKLLNDLLKKDFDGIECYYGKFFANEHLRWLKIAAHRNWLVTGGSDYHGMAKPNLNLGCSWVGQKDFQAILDRLATMS